MVTILISATFRGAALFRGRHLFHCRYPKVQRLFEVRCLLEEIRLVSKKLCVRSLMPILSKGFSIFVVVLKVLFILGVFTFIYFWKVNQASRIIPRCFWYGARKNLLLLKRKKGWDTFLVFLPNKISSVCLLDFGLKLTFY